MTTRDFNVRTAFLESKVGEESYVTLFTVVFLHEGRRKVSFGSQAHVRLLKSPYSLKQASFDCFKTFDHFLTSIRMQRIKGKSATYVLRKTKPTQKAIMTWFYKSILISDSDGSVERSLQKHF